MPIGSAAVALWTKTKWLRLSTPATVVAALAMETAVVSAQLLSQYFQAREELAMCSTELAAHLFDLNAAHEHVRVVGHSLGCLLLLRAIEQLKEHERPHEVHLCAPAVVEDEVAHILTNCTNRKNSGNPSHFVYHSDRDMVLRALFTALHLDTPIGAAGTNLSHSVDVSEHFDTWVHRAYGDRFHRFAKKSSPVERLQ